MKITFWSPVHGQPRTTSNLLVTALYSTLHYNMTNIITQTNFDMNNLEAPLVGTKTNQYEFFQDVGIDALARSIKSAPLDKENFYNCSISLLNKRLNLLAGTTKSNQEFFENDMEKVINKILKSAEQYYDIVFIDTNSGKNGFTMQVLEKSDLVVINLSQNISIINNFFNEYEFDPKKTFYLIGNYDRNSRNNIRNLRKQYKLLNSSNSSVIPYNTEFLDAQSDGQLIDFITRNIGVTKLDGNKYFMDKVAEASKKILKKAGWKGGIE